MDLPASPSRRRRQYVHSGSYGVDHDQRHRQYSSGKHQGQFDDDSGGYGVDYDKHHDKCFLIGWGNTITRSDVGVIATIAPGTDQSSRHLAITHARRANVEILRNRKRDEEDLE